MADIVARSICGELESYEGLMSELDTVLDRLSAVVNSLDGSSDEVASLSESGTTPVTILDRFGGNNKNLANLVARAGRLANRLGSSI